MMQPDLNTMKDEIPSELNADLAAELEKIQKDMPEVTDKEREFHDKFGFIGQVVLMDQENDSKAMYELQIKNSSGATRKKLVRDFSLMKAAYNPEVLALKVSALKVNNTRKNLDVFNKQINDRLKRSSKFQYYPLHNIYKTKVLNTTGLSNTQFTNALKLGITALLCELSARESFIFLSRFTPLCMATSAEKIDAFKDNELFDNFNNGINAFVKYIYNL